MLTKHLLRQGRLLRKTASLPHLTPIFKRNAFVDGGEEATLNDMPIPSGDYNEWYAKRNAKYNLLLGSGIAALLSVVMMWKTNDKLIFNSDVPIYEY